MSQRRLFLVDDHPAVRRGLKNLIDREHNLVVCGETGNADDVIPRVQKLEPDLVLLDISLGSSQNGLDVARRLNREHPDVLVLMLSVHKEALYADRALRAGARGYVMKRSPDDELLTAVRNVLAGRVHVSPAVHEALSPSAIREAVHEGGRPVEKLSGREREVFELLGKGFPPRHIANRLGIGTKTVGTYQQRIIQKLHLESTEELNRYAIAWLKDNQDYYSGGDLPR